ncbi:unnamed protein product [Clonostachys chloroleuca]|uniref:ATP-grasp domain-containing protein n=1 Tax=Clonostachys chloroleuca TaxID=1926264 RepID=A0AA35MI04_9HYPO|nr:unnamed protein product [Clonostachys chloroleuca]
MAADTARWHFSKNLFLLWLSFVLLPLDTTVIAAVHLWSRFRPFKRHHARLESAARPALPKTVLVTGLSMAKGLALARQFHRRGHRVIGADTRPLCMARVSTAVDRFYALPKPSSTWCQADPHTVAMLALLREENIDLWVSVSDVHEAMHDAQMRDMIEQSTNIKCIQLGESDTHKLHEKDLFMSHAVEIGLPVPDSKIVHNHNAIIHFLNKRDALRFRPGSPQYLVKQIEQDDHESRFDMTLLPLPTEQETLHHIHNIPVHTSNPFLIQEFIKGDEYCTHALVVKGQVRAFLACPSASLLLHYSALPPESSLAQAMLGFTERVAAAGGADFTGHVSFDFLVKPRHVERESSKDILDVDLFAIECNPRVHTAVLLFNDTPEVVDEFFTFDIDEKPRPPVFPRDPKRYYWVGQDLVQRVIFPLYQFFFLWTLTFTQLRQSLTQFAQRLLFWKDGIFEVWDPWPWWWLYHVYWPVQFLKFLVKGRWFNINVSTGKAFSAE